MWASFSSCSLKITCSLTLAPQILPWGNESLLSFSSLSSLKGSFRTSTPQAHHRTLSEPLTPLPSPLCETFVFYTSCQPPTPSPLSLSWWFFFLLSSCLAVGEEHERDISFLTRKPESPLTSRPGSSVPVVVLVTFHCLPDRALTTLERKCFTSGAPSQLQGN